MGIIPSVEANPTLHASKILFFLFTMLQVLGMGPHSSLCGLFYKNLGLKNERQ